MRLNRTEFKAEIEEKKENDFSKWSLEDLKIVSKMGKQQKEIEAKYK